MWSLQECESIPPNIPEEIDHSHLNGYLFLYENNVDTNSSHDNDACSANSDDVCLMNFITDISEYVYVYGAGILFILKVLVFGKESGPTISNDSEATIDTCLQLFPTI